MGTRADFYVQRGKKPLTAGDWIGSIAWNGYPKGIPPAVRRAKTPRDFRAAVSQHLSERDDFSSPQDGWPWPWEDSQTSDYAYVFTNGGVTWAYKGTFPDMRCKQNVQLGKKSGLTRISAD